MGQEMEKELKNVQDAVKYAGFKDDFAKDVKLWGESDEKDTVIKRKGYFLPNVNVELNLRKSEEGKPYFNSFDITLNSGSKEEQKHRFYINSPTQGIADSDGKSLAQPVWINSNFTFHEGVNLMSGRDVRKDFVTMKGEVYSSWVQLDDPDEKGNRKIVKLGDYDIGAKLALFDIPAFKDKTELFNKARSLEKGNAEEADANYKGKITRLLFYANAMFKSATFKSGKSTVFHKDILLVNQRESHKQQVRSKQGNEVSKGKDAAEGEAEGKGKNRRKQLGAS